MFNLAMILGPALAGLVIAGGGGAVLPTPARLEPTAAHETPLRDRRDLLREGGELGACPDFLGHETARSSSRAAPMTTIAPPDSRLTVPATAGRACSTVHAIEPRAE